MTVTLTPDTLLYHSTSSVQQLEDIFADNECDCDFCRAVRRRKAEQAERERS